MARPNDFYATRLADIASAETLYEIAGPIIRSKAKRLCRRTGFTPSDREDIEQNAHTRLLERFVAAERRDCPVIVFINQVVHQSLANQVRDRFAQKRDCRSLRSLNVPISSRDESGELAECVDQAQLDARFGRLSRSDQSMVEMGVDLEETIATFSQEQRDLCHALGVESISEIARRFQQPRTTVQDRVRAIRRAFEDASLQEYIEEVHPL